MFELEEFHHILKVATYNLEVQYNMHRLRSRVADPVGSGPFCFDPEIFHWIRIILWLCKVVPRYLETKAKKFYAALTPFRMSF